MNYVTSELGTGTYNPEPNIDIRSIDLDAVEALEADKLPQQTDLEFDRTMVLDGLGQYMRQAVSHKILERHQEMRLARLIERGDPDAKNIFIESNLKLVISKSKPYRDRGVDILDLIQEGNIGMMRAVEKFDWRKGFKFSSYAEAWMQQAFARAIIKQGSNIRIPQDLTQKINKVYRMQEKLQKQSKPSDVSAIAKELGQDESEVQSLLDIISTTISFETPVGSDQDGSLTIGNLIEDDDVDLDDTAFRSINIEILRKRLPEVLNNTEQTVIAMRYGIGYDEALTYEVIGASCGFTKQRAKQIIKAAEAKLASDTLLANSIIR